MTEEELKIFSLVAELGNNTEAAKKLNISQSSVSRAITKLENEVGAKLINRDTTPFTLTKYGAFLKNQLDRGMSISAQLSRYIQEQSIQQIKVGYAFPVSWELISNIIGKLKIYDPGIKISICQDDKFQIRQMLTENELDFAILPDKLNFSDYKIIETIDDYEWGVAAPSGVPITRKRYVEPEDLINLPVLIPGEKTSEEAITRWNSRGDMALNADTYNSLETLTGLINNGFGYGFAPKLEEEHLFRHDIAFYICHPKIKTSLYVYTRWHKDMSDELERFLKIYNDKLK